MSAGNYFRFSVAIAMVGCSNQRDAKVSTCHQQLRAQVKERMAQTWGHYEKPPMSPEQLAVTVDESVSQEHPPPDYGLAGQILAHTRQTQAIELLKRLLAHRNLLVSLEAALALAVLGDASGSQRLENPCGDDPLGALTNSGIEYSYAAAGLTLLGRPLPDELTKRHGIPVVETGLIERCQAELRAGK